MRAPAAGAPPKRRPEAGVAFAVTLVAFLPTLVGFHETWLAAPNTHGYAIAAATLWLVWRERSVFDAVRPWRAPLPFLAAASGLWLVARTANVQVLEQAALPMVLFTLAASLHGPAALRRLAPAAGLFLIAVPLWAALTPLLRALTVAVSSALLGLLRIPVTIDGTVISVTYGSFVIEDACAGLNYFMAAFTVGGIYAATFARTWRTRLLVVASALTLAVLGNWIRVTSLIVIGHVSRMEAGIIYDHRAFGWAVFVVFVLLVFFPLAGRLTRKEDVTGSGDGSVATEPAAPSGGRAFAAGVAVVAVLGPLVHALVGLLPPRAAEELAVAAADASWSAGGTSSPEAWRPDFTGADRETSSAWSEGVTEVTVHSFAYRGQAQGAELIGYGNRIAPDSMVLVQRLVGPVGPRRAYANEAIVRYDDGFVLVWYWYRVGGIETASPLKAKLLEIPAFFRRLELSELVAVSTACEPDSCEAAATTLRGFLGET